MCGVAGLWDRRRRHGRDALAARAGAMTETLHHRGPDAGEVWLDEAAGLALGHRRLSIVDLSPNGAQPMVSSCGRFVISYNGEVYNADELRRELEAAGRTFRGRCDTEVIVEGAVVWGVAATIQRLEAPGEIAPDSTLLLFGDQAYGSSIPFYLDRPLSRPALLVDGRSSSMLFGSTFPDAQPLFLTSAQLLAQWGTGPRKLLFVPLERRDDVDHLLGPHQIILQETAGKALLTDRPLDSQLDSPASPPTKTLTPTP